MLRENYSSETLDNNNGQARREPVKRPTHQTHISFVAVAEIGETWNIQQEHHHHKHKTQMKMQQ